MEITLRKASALQNSINDAVKAIELTASIKLNEFQDAEVEIAKASLDLNANVARRVALTDVLYEVRKAVSRANAGAGISERLADVAQLEKDIQFFNGLAANSVREKAVVLEGKLSKIRNRKDEGRASLYGYGDEVSTSVLTRKELDAFKSKTAEAKKQKQKLQDELLELNVRTTITLSGTAVDILKYEELV